MILKVKNLNKILWKKQVLNNVSFEVKSGELYGFLWPNGAGKTTTMKNILGFLEPDSGEIEIFWTKWLTLKDKEQIGFMPENTYLYKHLKTKEFLRFNGKFFGLKWDKLEKRIDKVLQRVGLTDAWDKYLKEFSKWMLQRIWLAQAIINKPKILFLDEPMSWLDPIWRKMVKNLLWDLKMEWTTIFFNTHILSDVESICDRVSIIHKWNIIVSWEKVEKILKKSSLEDFFIEKVTEFDWE
jgi:ABC-2 type transport system ATP-binding protein